MSPPRQPDDHLHVEQRVDGSAVIVRAAGELDIHTAPVLAAQLTRAAETVTPPAPVVADLSEVQFVGSRGLSLLLVTHQQLQQQRVPFRIVPGPDVTRRLRMAGLLDLLTTCPALTDAVHNHDLNNPAT